MIPWSKHANDDICNCEPLVLTRGRLAARTGCNAETIRYYEKIGLIPAPARNASGYRNYDQEHVRRLNFIQRARSLGFSGEQIQSLLDLSLVGAEHTRAEVKSLTETHIDDISTRIADLQKIKRRLRQISSHCDGSGESAQTCPILATLFEEK